MKKSKGAVSPNSCPMKSMGGPGLREEDRRREPLPPGRCDLARGARPCQAFAI